MSVSERVKQILDRYECNTFQRPRDQAPKLLDGIIRIYKGEA